MSDLDRPWTEKEVARLNAALKAMELHPNCRDCVQGKGTVTIGPPHCPVHDRHCSAEGCGW